MPDHVMLDLETMGNGPAAAIVGIGAVKFDPRGPEPPCCTDDPSGCMNGPYGFYTCVSLESSVRAGLVMDPSTVLWWLAQSDDAKAAVLGRGEPLSSALYAFSQWFGSSRIVWGHGAGFDPVIITSAYKAVHRAMPFDFHNIRDTRTIIALVEEFTGSSPAWKDVGTKHHAWWDAWRQAVVIQQCHQIIDGAISTR